MPGRPAVNVMQRSGDLAGDRLLDCGPRLLAWSLKAVKKEIMRP